MWQAGYPVMAVKTKRKPSSGVQHAITIKITVCAKTAPLECDRSSRILKTGWKKKTSNFQQHRSTKRQPQTHNGTKRQENLCDLNNIMC